LKVPHHDAVNQPFAGGDQVFHGLPISGLRFADKGKLGSSRRDGMIEAGFDKVVGGWGSNSPLLFLGNPGFLGVRDFKSADIAGLEFHEKLTPPAE
jgi:hypothetical protein